MVRRAQSRQHHRSLLGDPVAVSCGAAAWTFSAVLSAVRAWHRNVLTLTLTLTVTATIWHLRQSLRK
jgi:hypothetical protein